MTAVSLFQSPRLRLVEVIGDGMEPTLRPRDFALCKPVDQYVGEGIYLVSNALGQEFNRVDADSAASVRLMRDNPAYVTAFLSLADFNERVLAIVVADVKVRSPTLLREALS